MSESTTVYCTLDLKKSRVRIHKETLRQLEDPKYIKFLMHVEKGLLAICCDTSPFCGSAHKVDRIDAEGSAEIYSGPFLEKLASIYPNLAMGNSYRLPGQIHPEDRIAIFYINEATKIAFGDSNNRLYSKETALLMEAEQEELVKQTNSDLTEADSYYELEDRLV